MRSIDRCVRIVRVRGLRLARMLRFRVVDFSFSATSLIAALFVSCCFSMIYAQQAPAQPAMVQPQASTQTKQTPGRPLSTQSPVSPPARPGPPQLRFLVLLDPAHGGSDNGATLGPTALEKNYAMALAIRLHVLLNARGIHSVFTRDADVSVDNTARAVAANRAHAAACILLHATPTGNGVHLFTSSLPALQTTDARRSFLPWQTAQAGYGTQSLRLESDINAALANEHVPVLLDRTSLMPLDSMECPAVAIEIAPLNASTPLANFAYQEKIATSLATALVAWRSDWKLQP